MKRFWVSWYQPTEDYRPRTYPPNSAILGWWCSGDSPQGATLCAVVQAKSKIEVIKQIKADWPDDAFSIAIDNEGDVS